MLPYQKVAIDIKPEDCPNYLDLNSKGTLPVAICGTADLDVTHLDPASLRLSRQGVTAQVAPKPKTAVNDVTSPFTGEPCDCQMGLPDGFPDLLLKFDVRQIISNLQLADVAVGTITLTLTGKLKPEYCGKQIRGEDCVTLLPYR